MMMQIACSVPFEKCVRSYLRQSRSRTRSGTIHAELCTCGLLLIAWRDWAVQMGQKSGTENVL